VTVDSRFAVLMYHRVGRGRGDRRYVVSPRRFDAQMSVLARRGYRVLSLADALKRRDEGALPADAVVITFDDGFADCVQHAAPVLRRFGFPATFFLVSGRMGETNVWDGADAPRAPLMTWRDASDLAGGGFELASHSVTHPVLTALDAVKARAEIAGSRRALEDRLAQPIRFFAYPFGRVDGRVRDLVQEAGYLAACTTQAGFNVSALDPYLLRRFEITGTASPSMFRRTLVFGESHLGSRAVMSYYARRAAARVFARGH